MEFFRQILWQLVRKNLGLMAFLMATLLVGTLGYAILSKGQYSLLDCLYMTVITITTIGYGEIIDLLTIQREGCSRYLLLSRVLGLPPMSFQMLLP